MNTSVVSPGRAGLILLLTGQMLPLIDTSITNVALDSITHSLHATATELELIVALYGVAFAVCLAPGSKLGDNLGRRRLFMWGVASFGLASLLCGMAGNIEQLLAARIIQGANSRDVARDVKRNGTRQSDQSVRRYRRYCVYRRPDGWRLAGVGGHRRAWLA